MDTTLLIALLVTLLVGLALGVLVGVLWAPSRPAEPSAQPTTAALEKRAADDAVLREGLEKLHQRLGDLEQQRSHWQGQVGAQVESMRHTADTLRQETQSLSHALRKPQVRGHWGEMHLRRTVELAGLVDRCDFTEQESFGDQKLRPDLVVHLAGGASVVVDAKVPLQAFLDATSCDDPDEYARSLQRHAKQIRQHASALASKKYWQALSEAPEFVVMFVPSESFLSAGLDADGTLLETAAEQHVVLATPTTLIALLRTVAQGWQHQRLADQASEVLTLGREMHERLGTFAGHLDKAGRGLASAVEGFNSAVGSLESRVLVTGRKFAEMGVTSQELEPPRTVDTRPRTLSVVPDTPGDETDRGHSHHAGRPSDPGPAPARHNEEKNAPPYAEGRDHVTG